MLTPHDCAERAQACRDAAAHLLTTGFGVQRRELARHLQHDATRYERMARRRSNRAAQAAKENT